MLLKRVIRAESFISDIAVLDLDNLPIEKLEDLTVKAAQIIVQRDVDIKCHVINYFD